jgi:hypothetical protein
MCEKGVQLDDITFVCLLSAWSHAGLVNEGMHLHASMIRNFKIFGKSKHYSCMVDLLGHVGHLQEAKNMVKAMPYKPDVATWMVLFGACKNHNNVEMVERVAKWVLELEHKNVVGYMLLSNIYVVAGNKQDLRMLNDRKRKKV